MDQFSCGSTQEYYYNFDFTTSICKYIYIFSKKKKKKKKNKKFFKLK
jgi:hypothetical protein